MKKILAVIICMLMVTSSAFAQSLWFKEGANSGSWGIFSDHKAHDVGDIVTIVISERTSLQAQKSFTNEKEGSQNLGAGVGIFDFLKAASSSSFRYTSCISFEKNTKDGSIPSLYFL